MRAIGVVTGARSDIGILKPVLDEILSSTDLSLQLYVTGMHLSARHGLTVNEIESSGIPIYARIEMLEEDDTPLAIARSMGRGIAGFAEALTTNRPDLLLLLGDRFEMLSAALAALPFHIPMAHLHGGELTLGAIDDAIRHTITKLSHYHFVSTEEYRNRVIQMGEQPTRVFTTGAPGLDQISRTERLDIEALSARIGMPFSPAPLLVTYHPVTTEFEQTELQITALLDALREIDLPVVFTAPNADTYGSVIREAIEAFVIKNKDSRLVESFGSQGYFAMMEHAIAMVGNSSSGIIEAPSFSLPVVNIGTRQKGRLCAKNVLHVKPIKDEIVAATQEAVSTPFRDSLQAMRNPYGDGNAAKRIVEILQNAPLDPKHCIKDFYDLE